MRAKFTCKCVTNYGETEQIELMAVTGEEGENMDFNKYTPYGELKMSVDNPDARGFFVPNKEYYLNFTLAD